MHQNDKKKIEFKYVISLKSINSKYVKSHFPKYNIYINILSSTYSLRSLVPNVTLAILKQEWDRLLVHSKCPHLTLVNKYSVQI